MDNPTYRELRAWLALLDEEQLDMNVTVHIFTVDEFYPATHFEVVGETEDDVEWEGAVLDKNHPVIRMEY